MIKKFKVKFNKIFTRKKRKEDVVKMFENLEQELTICFNKIDKNIDDIMLYSSSIENIKLKINRLRKYLID